MTHESSDATPRWAVVRRVVAAAMCSEAIVVIGAGFVLAIGTLLANASSRAGAAFMALLVLLAGGGLVVVALGLWRGRRAARAPALVWQVLQLAVAVPALGSRPLIGVPLIGLAVVVTAGLLIPGIVGDPRQ
jgi:hypothetical protein